MWRRKLYTEPFSHESELCKIGVSLFNSLFFFFNNPPPPKFSPFPLHDPLPFWGGGPFALAPPAARRDALELFGELMQRPGHVVKTELRALHKDGSWRRLEAVGVNRLDDPAIRAIVVTYRDITERQRTERDLRETLSLLNATFESTTDGILVVDLAGHIISFNRIFTQLWRIPDSILEAKDSAQTLAFVLEQVVDPAGFLNKIRELYARPDASSFDVPTFKDRRIYERLSQPQRIARESVGRGWTFPDGTAP